MPFMTLENPLEHMSKGRDEWSWPQSIFGLPVKGNVTEPIDGEQYAYFWFGDNRDVWQQQGIESLQALSLNELEAESIETLEKHVSQLQQLKVLEVRNGLDMIVDGGALLAALPQLSSLYLSNIGVSFDVVRHSNLQQLYLGVFETSGLELLSLPQLRYLFFTITDAHLDFLRDALHRQAFPQLGHLGLYDIPHVTSVFSDLPVPPSLTSIGLEGWVDDERSAASFADSLTDLARWEGAAQLTHIFLDVGQLVVAPVLNKQHFPQLQCLKLKVVDQDRDFSELIELTWQNDLTLDLSESSLTLSALNQLCEVLQELPPLKALELKYLYLFNDTLDQATIERFNQLPYPVNFHQ